MSLYSPACRRSLSFSPSYFMKAEGFSAKMYLRLVGPFRSCHIMTEHYSISLLRHTYPQPILRYETPSLIICRWPSPQFSASLSFAFLLTNSVVKLTTVSVCQSESESCATTRHILSRRKLWFHLSLSLPPSLVAWSSCCLKVGQLVSILVSSSFFV